MQIRRHPLTIHGLGPLASAPKSTRSLRYPASHQGLNHVYETEWASFEEWSTEKDGVVDHVRRGIKRALDQRG